MQSVSWQLVRTREVDGAGFMEACIRRLQREEGSIHLLLLLPIRIYNTGAVDKAALVNKKIFSKGLHGVCICGVRCYAGKRAMQDAVKYYFTPHLKIVNRFILPTAITVNKLYTKNCVLYHGNQLCERILQ
jgi:hypothetical protein